MSGAPAVVHPGERPPWDEPPRPHPAIGARRRRAFALTAALVVVLLLVGPFIVGEVAVRVLIATRRLPVAMAHTRDFELTWTNLERAGAVDVLLLGDSLAQQGLDPARLADHLTERLGRPVTVFNGASSAGGFAINDAIVEQLAREGRLPKLVIIGVSPSSFGGDSSFRDHFAPSAMGGLFTDCAWATGYDAIVNCRAGQISALWRWRGGLGRVLQSVIQPLGLTSSSQGFLLRSDGFRSGPPRSRAELEQQVPTALGNQPAEFGVDPNVPPAYERLVGRLKAANVPVMAVAIPYSPVYEDALEQRRPGWEAARQAAVADLVRRTGVPVADPLRFGDWWGDGSSRDVKHLSREGAPRFVDQLWEREDVQEPLVRALGGRSSGSAGFGPAAPWGG